MKNTTPPRSTQQDDGTKNRIREKFSIRDYLGKHFIDAKFTKDGKGWLKVAGEGAGGLSFNETEHRWCWIGRGIDKARDCFDLVAEFEGLDTRTQFPDVLKRCADIAGVHIDVPDAVPVEMTPNKPPPTTTDKKQYWTYTDGNGKPLYQVVRYLKPDGGKGYFQQRADDKGGWIKDMEGVTLTLYRLPDVLETVGKGGKVFICEGEKCADALVALGLTATTHTGGAGKWKDEFSQILAGANIVIFPDDDDPGRKHADAVAASLKGVAASVKVVPLYPEGSSKKDVVDWLADNTVETLVALTDRTPVWVPETERVSTWVDLDSMIVDVSWAWKGWLPSGMLTMLVSESGKGKSALALRIADCYIRERDWPDGTRFNDDPGSVVWAEAESGQALNIGRAKSWGIPLDKIIPPLLNGLEDFQLDNPEHIANLRARAMRDDVKLLIVDSLSGATGRTDENTSAMLPLLKELASIARDSGKPVLALHHLNKGLTDGDGIHTRQVRGSSSIIQLSRVVWAIDEPDETDATYRRLSVIKNNLAPFPDRLGLRVGDNGVTFGAPPQRPQTESAEGKAKEFLKVILQRGAMPSTEVMDAAKVSGIAERTLKRAKEELGIVSTKTPKGWMMSMPVRFEPPEWL